MADAPAHLRRTLSLWQVTASGVGIVIGAGIYVLVGTAARETGSALWLSFALAATVSGLTAFSYAELAGLFPSAGAEYAFARAAFGRFAGFLSGWVMIAGNLVGAAAVTIGFGHYLRHFVDVDVRIGALGLLTVLTALVVSGIQRSIWFSAALVVLQISGLILVIAAGAPHVGERDLLADASAAKVFSGAALVFFAFIGFDEIVTLSEETKDPERTVPRAILLSLGISTLLYVLVGVTAVSAVGAEALGASETPLALVMRDDWGRQAADIVAFIALASTTNTSLLMLIASSRLIYRISSDGYFPQAFARLSRAGAPFVAAIAVFAVAAVFAAVADIELVASVTDFIVFITFLVVNAAVIGLRFKLPDRLRTMSVPLTVGRVPGLAVLAFGLTALMMASLKPEAWALGAGSLVAGALVWLLKARRAGEAAQAGPASAGSSSG